MTWRSKEKSSEEGIRKENWITSLQNGLVTNKNFEEGPKAIYLSQPNGRADLSKKHITACRLLLKAEITFAL